MSTPTTPDTQAVEALAALIRQDLIETETLPTITSIAGYADDLRQHGQCPVDTATVFLAIKRAVKLFTFHQTQNELAIMAEQTQALGRALATGQHAHADTYKERIIAGLARIDALLAQQAPFLA